MGQDYRSKQREKSFPFRMSAADRDALRARAAKDGVSVQTYLERVVFDRPLKTDLPPGPAGQQELPLTG